MEAADDLAAVALLAEPLRQRLYEYLRERGEPVGREEAAQHTGITARLAAFHLDRMAEVGLLDIGYRRLSGRSGPGAGRPAKLYSISSRKFEVVIPQTRYALAASMMATALDADGSQDGPGALQEVAATVGEKLGEGIRKGSRTKKARQEAVQRQLAQLGYEPQVGESGVWTLRNCIFAELSGSHRQLVCGMNAALVAGMLDGARVRSLHLERRAPGPACCVQLTSR
jgi:predicted ArsR family transcriptional regulator